MTTSTGSPFVLWIDEPEAVGSKLLGGKFASLAEMTAGGFAVPGGFGITTTAYRYFLESAGLAERARQVRTEAVGADLARVRLQALCSQYGWALWGFIQAATSNIGFDFHGWGTERYEKAARTFASPDLPGLLRDVAT